MNKGWIIQLRREEDGGRYYSARGDHIAYTRDKAKVFGSKEEADKVSEKCTLWEERIVIEI